MSKIFTPVNQIRLTNVAVVRLKKGGKRFEIACYKNKVIEFREGIEKNLDEVLQSDKIFSNVAKGQTARRDDIIEVFKTDDMNAVCMEILKKGELQVGEKERHQQHTCLLREIAQIISDKCVNPETKNAYTVSVIENALKEIHFSVNVKQNAKKQALDAIKQIQSAGILPIQRAMMKLKITLSARDAKVVREKILKHLESVSMDSFEGNSCEIIGLAEPGAFKIIQELIQSEIKGRGSLEILAFKETNEDDVDMF